MASMQAKLRQLISEDHPNRSLLLLAGFSAAFVALKHEFTPYMAADRSLSKEVGSNADLKEEDALYIPSTLSGDDYRSLATSLDLGGGNCKWQPPRYEVPEEMDFYKTVVAGYPSGDKRMIWLQMEALSGWPAKDEWVSAHEVVLCEVILGSFFSNILLYTFLMQDFAYMGITNHPFIKVQS